MVFNITCRWMLIYGAIGGAAAPLIFNRQVDATHFIWAIIALVLIYFVPKTESKEK